MATKKRGPEGYSDYEKKFASRELTDLEDQRLGKRQAGNVEFVKKYTGGADEVY